MKKAIIHLEDNGEDFLRFIVEDNRVVKAEPFQSSIWEGAYVPVIQQKVGDFLMIHHPPNIVFGFLKHKVEKIEELN